MFDCLCAKAESCLRCCSAAFFRTGVFPDDQFRFLASFFLKPYRKTHRFLSFYCFFYVCVVK
jgi:hypothetical protein